MGDSDASGIGIEGNRLCIGLPAMLEPPDSDCIGLTGRGQLRSSSSIQAGPGVQGTAVSKFAGTELAADIGEMEAVGILVGQRSSG